MSAWLVEKQHVIYLVRATEERNHEVLAKQATMLWNENRKSINSRYREEEPLDLEVTPEDIKNTVWSHYDSLQVINSARCLNYQSCEHEGWEASDANQFLQRLIMDQIYKIRGYDQCKWGYPEPIEGAMEIL